MSVVARCSVCGTQLVIHDEPPHSSTQTFTCPVCGQPTMDVDPEGGMTRWD